MRRWDYWIEGRVAETISFEDAIEKLKKEKGKWDLLFVYGTLKRREANHHLMLNSYFIDEAKTKHKYWRAGFISTYDKPIEGIEPQQVEGEVYLVPVSDLKGGIDTLEGHPRVYTRKKVPVLLKHYQKEVKAWLYFLNKRRG